MATCPACGTPTTADLRFCVGCGAALGTRCPSCGSAVQPGTRFCGQCGMRLDAPGAMAASSEVIAGRAPTSAGTEVERRLVSVLFADLVGSTASAETRDPEEVREALTRYFEVAE